MSRALVDAVSQSDDTSVSFPDVARPPALIEELLPEYDYRQRFSTFIPSARPAVFTALGQLRFSDLTLLRILMAIRSLGRTEAGSPNESILNGTKLAPYVLTDEVPEQESVVALMGRFWTQNAFAPIPGPAAFAEPAPDYVRTVWSLRLVDTDGGTHVTAETRVKNAAEPVAARKFRAYWYLMGQIGSATFSLSMLAALKHRIRSEASTPVDPALACGSDTAWTVATLAGAAAAVGAVIVLLRRTKKAGPASPLDENMKPGAT